MRPQKLSALLFALLAPTLAAAQGPAAATQPPPHYTANTRANVTSYKPQPYDSSAGFTLSDVTIAEQFSGDMVGSGTSHLILITAPATSIMGVTGFTGIEKFVGSLGPKTGSFLFENQGALTGDKLRSTWRIVAGSGAGDLKGIRGQGGCTPDGCQLEYWFFVTEP